MLVLWCVAERVCKKDTKKGGKKRKGGRKAFTGLSKAEGEQEDGTP